MALTSAQAEVQVVPTMRGFGAKVNARVKSTKVPPLQVQVNIDRKSLAAAEAEARSASARIAKAREVEQRASEGVRLAEQRLTEARKTQAAGSAQLIAAENRLAQAKRQSVAASTASQRAMVDDEAAKRRVVAANAQLERSTSRLAGTGGRLRAAFGSIDTTSVRKLDKDISRTSGSALKLVAVSFAAGSALTSIGGATGPILAVSAALVSAAGAAALLPGALAAAGAGFAAIKIGTSGIADAFKAQSAASTQAAADGASSAAKQATQQRTVRDALSAVDQAASQAARTRIDGEKRVQDAVESAQETAISGARSVRSASDDVTSARERAADAEQSYRDAVKDATLALRDLNVEMKSSSLSVDEAQLSLDQANERLKELRATAGTNPLDMRAAELSVKRASISLEEARNRYDDVKLSSAESAAVGVLGAKNVVAAQRGVQDANKSVEDAELKLRETRADAAAANDRAQEDIREATADAAQANADAALRVQEAQQRVADAYAQTGTSASSAAQKANAAMADLSPNARAFVSTILGMKGAWDDLKNSVQDRLFAGLAAEVQLLGNAQLPVLRDGLTGVAAGMNTAALDTSQFVRSAQGVSLVRSTLDNTSVATGNLARSAAPLTNAFLGFAAIGSTFLPGLASGFSNAAERAAAFVNSAAGAQQIREWIAGGLEAIRQLVTLIWNLGSIIGTVFSTANAVGGSTIQMLNNLVGAAAAWLKSAEGQRVLIVLFTAIRDVVNALLPGVRAIGGALMGAFLTIAPALPALGQAFSDVAIALAPIIVGLGNLLGFILPPLAATISFLAPIIGMWAAQLLAVVVAFKIATGAIALFNLVMNANPIVLVITAIVALVAGLIYAYNNFAWFKSAVDGTWNFLKTVAGWVATAFVGAWNFLGTAFRFLGDVFSSVWTGFLKPVLDAFLAVATFVGKLIIALVVGPLVLAWQGLSAAFMWAYRNVLEPMFLAFRAIAMWLYIVILKPIFAFIQAAWFALMTGFRVLYDTILAPLFRAFRDIAMWLYMNVLVPIFTKIGAAWDGLSKAFSFIYDKIIRPIFGYFQSEAERFKVAFGKIVDGVKSIWNGIKEAFKAPVIFVLETVWNKGIGGLWNAAKKVFPLGDFPAANVDAIRRMATGGPVRGPGGPTADKIPTMLSNGEHVLTASEVRAAGGHGAIATMRQQLRAGMSPTSDAFYALPRALGGPVGWQELWGAVRGQFPQARLTSSYRPGDPGYHGKGKAVDIAGPRSMDMPFMLNVNRWIAANYGRSSELIHTQPGAVNIKDGRPHTYNAATREGHRNHVHWANGSLLDGVKGRISNAWGDIMSFAQRLTESFLSPEKWIRDTVAKFFPPNGTLAGDMPLKLADWGIKKAKDLLFGKANEMDASGSGVDGFINAPGAGVQRWAPLVLKALAYKRQPASLLNVVLRRMNQESGGNPNAINNWDINAKRGTPSGGLLQTIKPTFLANHEPGTSFNMFDPWANILASMNYAIRRYGSLPAAYNRRGGYKVGGVIPGSSSGRDDTLVLAQSGERVLTERQNVALEALAGVSSRGVSPVLREVMRGRDLNGVGRGQVSRSVTGIHTDQMVIREQVDMDQALSRAAFAASGI